MKWLRDAHVRDGETFTELVNRLTPALTRGELTASGVRKADVLAHLGWAAFLKSRDTGDTSAVAAYYQRALQVDPGNPFAHANAGHLLLWQHGSIEAAQQHFAAGLVTGRERAFVRRMQLAALKNSSLDEADASFVHVINDMRQSNESIDEDNRGALYSLYYFAVTRPSGLQHFVAAVPAAEQIATLRALFTGSDFEASKSPVRDASIATLLEFAGQSDEALATWRALQATFTPRDAGSVVALTNAAIKRLTPAHSAAKRR